jgi:hypothetical protein
VAGALHCSMCSRRAATPRAVGPLRCLAASPRGAARRLRTMPARGVVRIFVALADFVAAVYGADDAMLNDVLGGCRTALDGRRVDAAAEAQLLDLLSSSLRVRASAPTVLFLPARVRHVWLA